MAWADRQLANIQNYGVSINGVWSTYIYSVYIHLYVPTGAFLACPGIIEEGYRQKRRQRSSLVFGLLNKCTSYFPPGWFEEKDEKNNRYLTEWMLGKNGCSSGSYHTKPPPYQNGCSPKTFVQIILAANWLVRHSSMSPKQLRQPFPSLLFLSFFYNK